MRPFVCSILAILCLAGPVEAAQPSWWTALLGAGPARASHRPDATRARPAVSSAASGSPAASTSAPPVPVPRPRPQAGPPQPGAPAERPGEAVPAAEPSAPAGAVPPVAEGESTAPKPPRIYQTACPALISGLVAAKPLPPIADGQCQAQSPLSVTAILVNGRMLPLSSPATFDCQMATDFPGWVADVDNYVWSTENAHIKSVTVGESYVCRPRNTPDGSADLSEHGRADALDFVGFRLEDGRSLDVATGYASPDEKLSRLMHFAHDAACTRFTTVLGPDANALHHDHFHLDLGCHGKTCTYRLCE